MVDLVFDCVDCKPDRYAASPALLFTLRIAETSGAKLHSIGLRCQFRIEPQRRRYSAGESARLTDLFGEPERYGETLHPMQFATVPVNVQGFTGSTEVEVPVACSYDLEVATGRYFDSLDDGEVPLVLLFSGTIFYRGDDGNIAVTQVPWDKEASYRLPVPIWREMIDIFFPASGWLMLHHDTLRALGEFKSREAVAGWDETVALLLERAGEERP
jgi:hypothetical protein